MTSRLHSRHIIVHSFIVRSLFRFNWCRRETERTLSSSNQSDFSGSGPTHFFRSWVRIGIGPTHFLRWTVYYCVCIQHDIDKSQISFTELCKTFRTNSGLRGIDSCLHLFWPSIIMQRKYPRCFLCRCFVMAEFKIFISPADCGGVWTHPSHFYTDLRAARAVD